MRPWQLILLMIVCSVPWLASADGVGDAILRLPVVQDDIARTLTIDSPIYSARLGATIRDVDGSINNFSNRDTITFTLTGRNGRALSFPPPGQAGTRPTPAPTPQTPP
jgi:hypothetical protein